MRVCIMARCVVRCVVANHCGLELLTPALRVALLSSQAHARRGASPQVNPRVRMRTGQNVSYLRAGLVNSRVRAR